MKLIKMFTAFLAVVFSFFLIIPAWAQNPGRSPATAFDPLNNRYLMVWHDAEGSGTAIKGKFVNPDGSDAGSVEILSPPRPTQGCFYGNFDADNGEVSTPTDCGLNVKPSVAYNNGQFILVWEVQGQASAPSSSPENEYSNIFARILNADDLSPVSGWDEGILISKVFIAANNADACGNGKFACNDSEIQAWSQSKNAHVAPRINDGGFVVTWETNKDFIGCANRDRRAGWSVYGRYIDENFSATSSSNPAMFSVFKDDSTAEESCAPIENVDNGTNPRIAYNESTNDFVIVYELGRANGGRTSIGAKRVTVNGEGAGQVDSGSMMGGLVATLDGGSLSNPDIVSHQGDYVLFVDDGAKIRAKKFTGSSISASTPDVIDLGGGDQTNPVAASNLGAGGQGPTTGDAPTRLAVSYVQGENVFTALLDNSLAVVGDVTNVSDGAASNNRNAAMTSNTEDFLTVWQGNDGEEKVFVGVVDSGSTITPPDPEPPTAPGLLLPADGVTFAPTRAFLSWDASTDPDGDDANITYNVYFGEDALPGTPQVTGLTETHFVISPETEPMTGITLQANRTYVWAVEAVDEDGDSTTSAERILNTDDSVLAWWRFDEDPNGPDCAGGDPGESVCDSSGNNHHGILNGNPVWIMPGMPDLLGGALEFDGNGDFVSVGITQTFTPNSFSILSIFNPDGSKTDLTIILDNSDDIGFGFDLLINFPSPESVDFHILDGNQSNYDVIKDNALKPNSLNYITATFEENSGEVNIFADGSLLHTQNLGNLVFTPKTQGPLTLGQSGQGAVGNFQGILDENIIINREIPAAEVQNNYNSAIMLP